MLTKCNSEIFDDVIADVMAASNVSDGIQF